MKNGEKMYGLIAGRHNLPVDGYILESVPDVMDFVAIRDEIYKFVEGACALRHEYDCAVNQTDATMVLCCHGDPLNVIVTGLSAVTAALVSACAHCGVSLTLWHYDRDTQDYKPQHLWF